MKRSQNQVKNLQQQDENPQHQSNSRPEYKQKNCISPELDINNRFDTQLLRIKLHEHSKIIQQIFTLTESQLTNFILTYPALPYSQVNLQSLIQSKSCKLIKNSEGKIYIGQTSNKKKHGIGVAIYKEGKIYEGQFLNNQRHGYGVQVYSNGNIYIGNFVQNKKHSKGVFFWFNLSEIPCTKSSEVVIEHYKGNWWGGLPDGKGEHYKSNGDIYIGNFKNGLKHGDGIERYSNGDLYEGQFVNGLPQGYGQYIWKDQSEYKGDFKQGYRNGYGIWINRTKEQTYQGHYMLDKKHGFGVYCWGNGYSYKGNYSDDHRSGQGKLFYQDQIVYEGSWKNGEKRQFDSTGKRSKLFSGSKIQTQSSLTKSTNIKSRIYSSKQKKSIANNSIERNQLKSIQKPKTSKTSRNRSEAYCVSFKHEQKTRIGHRNCVPCNLFGKKTMHGGNSTSKQKNRSTSKNKS